MRRPRRPLLPPRAATRLAFGVIVVFVLAQVIWWLLFQERYIRSVTESTLAAWQRDAATASLALEASGGDSALEAEFAARYPHLRLAESGAFEVDPGARGEFERRQRGYVRMFTFEGPFFVLVILAMLALIARSLRTERELKRRQQNFLSAITHEFKTPISTLRLLIETALMRSLPPEKQRDYLERMKAELARLEQTSEQVLASARLEQARLDPDAAAPSLAAAELNQVLQGIVGRVGQGLEARGARLEVRFAPEPLPVSIDEAAFHVVIGNLLDNAVKYSPGAEKPVTVTLERDSDLILVHVDDEGVGIPEAEQGRVFDRFYRSGDELTRSASGVGLGLHLVRSITEAMNGWVRIGANPRAGGGSRFTVVLPRRVTLEPREGQAGSPPDATREAT